MPPSGSHGSLPFASFRRPILTIRNVHVHSVELNPPYSSTHYPDIDLFQKQIFNRLNDLSSATTDELLSIKWIRKLLDTFVSCQDEFKVILRKNKAQMLKPPLDRLVLEYLDRNVKALDICNAARDGIEKIRLWQKHLDIVLCSLDSSKRNMGEGQFRRARKALTDLALVMLEVKEAGSVLSHRNLSFGRNILNRDHHHSHQSVHARSLSWSVSNSWSASKQLQSIGSNLVSPRGNDIAATNGLAIPVFAMNYVLLFVLWTLVAAFPCQDRGIQLHFSIPRHFSWSAPIYSLHGRIVDESKKRDRRNSSGLLEEIHQIEKQVHRVTDLVDSAEFPLIDDQKEEVRTVIRELSAVCERCRNGLDPLDRQLKEVFHKIMSCRTEGLQLLGKMT